MAGQNPGVSNAAQFESYFQRADLDRDGKITGAEAVAFFKGSNLPQQVLAQIWMHADQNRAGFLGRQEFYNALKLVTVAQSKRELTPDIVKAALYGPAAAKIPPPQINLSAIPSQQANPMATASTPQMGAATPVGSQGFGFRGPGVPNASMPQQQIRPLQAAPVVPQASNVLDFSRGGNIMGQGQTMSTSTASRPSQPIPAVTPSPYVAATSISNDWLGGNSGGAAVGSRSISPSTSMAAPRPQGTVSMPSQPVSSDSKSIAVSGNGFTSSTTFRGDVFSALTTTTKKEPFTPTGSTSGSPALPTSATASFSGTAQPLTKAGSLDSLQSALSSQPSGSPLYRTQSLGAGPQVSAQCSLPLASSGISAGAGNSAQYSSPLASSGISAGVGNSVPDNSQLFWPKMKPSDIQKYTKVFIEVDTDRDGRITGEQARNLFLSWRLPREVLKQVWDLSDQDNDSMLSLREFCFALYLMERFREGRPLPATLPRNVMLDETLLSMTGQPNANYGNTGWVPSPGFGQQQMMGVRSITPATGVKPPVPVSAPNAEVAVMSNQQTSRAPALDDSFANQLDNGEENKVEEATAAGTKVDGPEKVILDSREKIEFYRSKMQELVLYKSRCDNRLNEITERAIADKRESEMLAKKYEEKYKQVAEIASKLTIEEAKFRELQERKMELHQAIAAVERGGSADGILQVRADRIQSDLEELLKALIERSKKHNLDVKSSALIELPYGWQPGIQENAAVWDEEWDKFDDEGFGNELTVNVKDASASPNAYPEKASPGGTLTPDSLSNAGDKSRNLMNGEHAPESESAFTHSEDELARSPHGSSVEQTAADSPSQEFSDVFRSTEADTETHRSFDDSTWGAFDNDDTDSVWGFNAVSTKGFDSDKQSNIFGSPSGESTIHKKSPFTFDDSVPGTPMSRFGNSPPRFSDFDSFSRFDSFGMSDSRFSSQPDKLTRFDSMNSSTDFGGPERLTRFDSINSTKDFGKNSFYSFDDDPFGSTGPFKVSSDPKSTEKF